MRRYTILVAAIAAVSGAREPRASCASPGEAQGRRRRRRQDAVLLPAADDRAAEGLLQGRRPRGRAAGLPGRGARTAGAPGRQCRHRVGRLRAHDHAAGEGPEHRGDLPAGQVLVDGARDEQGEGGEIQLARGPQGNEDRRDRARLVDQHDRQHPARQGRISSRTTCRSSAPAQRQARWRSCSGANSTRS